MSNTPVTIDKYQIIQSLGAGYFGEVFHAFDRALMIEKAIKVLKVTDPNQFLKHLEEAQILKSCMHKHIVTINEANIFPVEGDDRVVLDLEYIHEGSLEHAMKNRWISMKEAVSYIRGTLLGLEHAHLQGILHRDIKPGNILLAQNCAKLSDFGLATNVNPGQAGSAKGYTTHLAPEYFANRETSQQTDLFAMGITLFRAITNLAGWRAVIAAFPKKQQYITNGTLIREIGYPEFIPSPLRRIINRACAPDPAKRYETASEFGQKLDSLRFGIDWYQQSEFEWVGIDDSGRYQANIDGQKKRMEIKKNGRRINQLCKSYSTIDETVTELHKNIANTSLK